MESLKKLVEKMEAPLLFATENTYKRLPLVKNLETVMTFLLQRLKEELHSEPQPRNDEIDRLSSALLELFDGYDSATQEQKKDRLAEAIGHVSALKAIAGNPRAISGEDRRSSIHQEEERFLAFPPCFVCPWCGSSGVSTSGKK